jgi:hypothetical protein
MEYYDY